jgi:tetratricopeptide (TPR) repeat protein
MHTQESRVPTFGDELHRWRLQRGLSLRRLAKLVNYTHGHLWDIEQGRRPPVGAFAAQADRILEADGALIAAAAGRHVADLNDLPDESAGWTQDSVRALARRLSQPGAATPATDPDLPALAHEWILADPEPLRAVANGGRVGACMVDGLGAVVDELRRHDDEEGGEPVLHLAEPELQFVARLLARCSYTEDVGQALHIRLAELAQLAGWGAYDAGLYDLSQVYLDAALRASCVAQAPILGAYVLSSLGFLAPDIGRPLEGVAILKSAALGVRDIGTPQVHAVLGTWEARAAARAGERRMFERALLRASSAFEKGSHADDPDWAYWMIQPELTAEAGRAFALVGDTANSLDYLARGLADLGPGYPRDRALYMAYLAEANLIAGTRDEAWHWAATARSLVPQLRSPRATEHLEKIEQRLVELERPARWAGGRD